MTSSLNYRFLISGLLTMGCVAFGQQPAATPARPPKPGVPAVQAPVSYLIPDASYIIEAEGGIKGRPDWLSVTDDSVWVNSRDSNMIWRMDPKSDKILATVRVGKPCSGFAVAAGTLWSPSCSENVIYRIDLKTNEVVAKVPVGPANSEGGIAFGAGSAWMPSDPKGVVSRVDPATNKVIAEVAVPPDSFVAVYSQNLVWVSSTAKSVVSVIHPASNKVIAEIPVGLNPRFMAAGEGFIWTLNQGSGTVSKIDPRKMKVVATIDPGVPGTGGDIAVGEGAVWVTQNDVPLTRIDPSSNKVTAQLVGVGGDAMRVGHGFMWLSHGRQSMVWRFPLDKVVAAAPHSWTMDAQQADLNGDGKPDVLVEDLATYIPGAPASFRIKVLDPGVGTNFTLKTKLNGKSAETAFVHTGDEWIATLAAPEARWIHYSVCVSASAMCSPELVVASPTTTNAYATAKTRFVPATFLAPAPPPIDGYRWNILEPEIVTQDFDALMHTVGRTTPATITAGEDYGELKRHRWEFQRETAFAYGILVPDGTSEVACVYVQPSKKQGYDAVVRFLMTERGAKENLPPLLEATVREWIKTKWPFAKVAFPGVDVSLDAWNALPDAPE